MFNPACRLLDTTRFFRENMVGITTRRASGFAHRLDMEITLEPDLESVHLHKFTKSRRKICILFNSVIYYIIKSVFAGMPMCCFSYQ
ncbi:MAG TPA: hypothetical protein DHU26_06605 [Spirochaetaceae bacterium]|nr:hypothetical protein [Spirochaetaceae bacterium]